MTRSAPVKLLLFFVLGAALCVGAAETLARVFPLPVPPLDVMTGARIVPPPVPAESKAAVRILWLSPTPMDAPALAAKISAQLRETVDVVTRGEAHDTIEGLLCRYRRQPPALTATMVVVDVGVPTVDPAHRSHDLNAPCIFDDDGRAWTQLPAAPWDDTLRGFKSYAAARVWMAQRNLPPPGESGDAVLSPRERLAADILASAADPIFVRRDDADDAVAKATRQVALLNVTFDDAGGVSLDDTAEKLVNHYRERVLLLKTSVEREVISATLSPREQLAQAATKLGDLKIELGSVAIDAALLQALCTTDPSVSLTKALREKTRRPIDLDDFLSFLDDAIASSYGQFRSGKIVLTPGRARDAGVFVHPDEVFKRDSPRPYPGGKAFLPITEPKEPEGLVPARDGERLGPNWYLRYENPETEAERVRDLVKRNKKFGRTILSLVSQLRRQGADVLVESTVRAKERGYLMWGAFWLSRAKDDADLQERLATLKKLRDDWKLDVNIDWDAGSFAATTLAARDMAETYGVVYATRRGAEKSDHYDGKAVDITAVGLPEKLTLKPPGKRARTFDLSGDDESRDLSVSPALIKFIERGFRLKKLKSDYPHWSTR